MDRVTEKVTPGGFRHLFIPALLFPLYDLGIRDARNRRSLPVVQAQQPEHGIIHLRSRRHRSLDAALLSVRAAPLSPRRAALARRLLDEAHRPLVEGAHPILSGADARAHLGSGCRLSPA